MDEDVGAPLVGAHENISRVEPNENNQGTHKGCPYGVVTPSGRVQGGGIRNKSSTVALMWYGL